MSQFKTLEVTIDKGVCVIILNRPKKYNAVNMQMYVDFGNALKSADNNKKVNVIVITGNGKYFSSGNDLSGMGQSMSGDTKGGNKKQKKKMTIKDVALASRVLLTTFTESILNVRKPIICGVNGPSIGIACTMLGLFDIVYASETATFDTPFSKLGQSPEGLSSYIFPKLMGKSKAMEVLLMGLKLTATEAHKYNLISDVWPTEGFRERLLSVAYKMAKFPPNGLIKVKQLIRSSEKDIYKKTMEMEMDLLIERWQSPECLKALLQFQMQKKKKRSKM